MAFRNQNNGLFNNLKNRNNDDTIFTSSDGIQYTDGTIGLDIPVIVEHGGTNSTTPLNNNRLLHTVDGQIVERDAMTNGEIVIGSTGTGPVNATLTASDNTIIENGPGSITVKGRSHNLNSVGSGVSVYKDSTDSDTGSSLSTTHNLKSITAGSGITIDNSENEIQISSNATSDISGPENTTINAVATWADSNGENLQNTSLIYNSGTLTSTESSPDLGTSSNPWHTIHVDGEIRNDTNFEIPFFGDLRPTVSGGSSLGTAEFPFSKSHIGEYSEYAKTNILDGVPTNKGFLYYSDDDGKLRFRKNDLDSITDHDLTETTGSNLGFGEEVFSGAVANNLAFKTLLAGSNVTLMSDAHSITINTSGGESGGGGGDTIVELTSSNSEVPIPAGSKAVDIYMCGGGGGGGGYISTTGGGGGGGASCLRLHNIPIVNDTALDIQLGQGGIGGNSSLNGTGGSISTVTFNNTARSWIAYAGGGGSRGGGAGGGGGSSGSGSNNINDGSASGGNSLARPLIASQSGGGGASQNSSAGPIHANAATGLIPGSGGGGGGSSSGVGRNAGTVMGTPGGLGGGAIGGGGGGGNSVFGIGGNGAINNGLPGTDGGYGAGGGGGSRPGGGTPSLGGNGGNGYCLLIFHGSGSSGGGGGLQTASNLGPGEYVLSGVVGSDIQFKSVASGDNTTVTANANTITIDSRDHTITGSGTANPSLYAGNISGFGGPGGKYTTHLLKDLAAGTNVTLTPLTHTITISADNTTYSASNLGTGEEIYAGVIGTDFQFKTLVAGNNVSLSSDSNAITVNSNTGLTTMKILSSTTVNVPTGTHLVKFTAVGGGGSGGSGYFRQAEGIVNGGGGGGSGGVIVGYSRHIGNNTTINVTIGQGGALGAVGGNTVIQIGSSAYIAYGGGGGLNAIYYLNSGGSGGGGAGSNGFGGGNGEFMEKDGGVSDINATLDNNGIYGALGGTGGDGSQNGSFGTFGSFCLSGSGGGGGGFDNGVTPLPGGMGGSSLTGFTGGNPWGGNASGGGGAAGYGGNGAFGGGGTSLSDVTSLLNGHNAEPNTGAGGGGGGANRTFYSAGVGGDGGSGFVIFEFYH